MKLLARSALKKPFVKTVASVAMLGGAAAGCTGTEADVITNPPPKTTSCPETKPTEGACDLPAGTSCGYDDCYGTPSTKVSCEDGEWSFSTRSCNPPEPSCPEAAPTEGSACSTEPYECNYGDCYGAPTTTASCKDGTWELSTRTCNPPAPVCPEAKPADDSACAAELAGIECKYDDCYGTPNTTATCKDGKWDVATIACNPPPPKCPETKPVDGSTCTAEDGPAAPYQCTYDDCAGTPSTTATCKDGTWNVVTMSCNPPPPSD